MAHCEQTRAPDVDVECFVELAEQDGARTASQRATAIGLPFYCQPACLRLSNVMMQLLVGVQVQHRRLEV